MTIELAEEQFEIGGLVFGLGTDLLVETFGPEAAEWTVQDVDNPVGDGQWFGRDTLRSPTWTLECSANQHDADAATNSVNRLAAAWRTAADPRKPGSTAVLRYRVGSHTRRVVGRPRRFAVVQPDPRLSQGYLGATCDFQLACPVVFDDVARSTTVTLVSRVSSGWTWPVTWPISLGEAGTVEGVIDDVGGRAATPLVIEVTGPVTDPVVAGPGWRLALRTSLAYDQTVVIDTAAATVLRSDGVSLAGTLTRESLLTDAQLVPGSARVTFTGTDATRTARCVVSWRPAYHAI